MAEPYRLSLAELAIEIKRKKLSPVALAESLLARIHALEPSLRAWTTIDRERVLQEAHRRDREIRRGKWLGPLHGVPIGVKDIYFTAGVKTTAGSKILADFVPAYDATAVERLKKAGAIILGKTASTEFAYADPAPTRNPWNLNHTPGGSSSGSAAAVAVHMCPAALGSQTGGSILRPAAYCGIVGLKPTYGRISRHGVFPFSWTLDHMGPLTRTVEDAAILLSVLAGHDPRDPTSSMAPVSNYRRALRSLRRPPRLGLVRAFYQEKADPPVWEHTEKVIRRLRKAGARVEEVTMPESFAVAVDAHRIIMRVEGASVHEDGYEKHRDLYGPKLRELIEIGLMIRGVDYLRARKIREQFCREMDSVMENFDCLITPTTPSAAPSGLSSTGDSAFQAPWSFSGLPSINLPSGLDPEGLPLGVQLVGAAFGEGKLLAAASFCEKALPFSQSPPLPAEAFP